jgi:hypothetical protein
MPALAREALFAACRAIYEMAGENYALPPLIRDAQRLETQSRYHYKIENDELHFVVELDESRADRNVFPFSKLPLRFRIELRETGAQNQLIELDENEKWALIRAFLLGAKAPIGVERNVDSQRYKIFVQLSSTFFAYCGELIDNGHDYTSKELSYRVGRELYESSKEFFGSSQDGLYVWSTRVAQDLFGEPKPPPEIFWPPTWEEPEAVSHFKDVSRESRQRAKPGHSGYAVAVASAITIIGLAGLGTNFGPNSRTSLSSEKAAATVDADLGGPRPETAGEKLPVRFASIIDSAPLFSPAAVIDGATQHFGAWGAQEKTRPAVVSAGGRSASARPSGAAYPQSATSIGSASALYPEMTTSETRPNFQITTNPAFASKSETRDKHRQRAAKAKLASSSHGHGRWSSSRSKRRQLNPLAFVKRSVDALTRLVVKDLKRVNSVLMAGRERRP